MHLFYYLMFLNFLFKMNLAIFFFEDIKSLCQGNTTALMV